MPTANEAENGGHMLHSSVIVAVEVGPQHPLVNRTPLLQRTPAWLLYRQYRPLGAAGAGIQRKSRVTREKSVRPGVSWLVMAISWNFALDESPPRHPVCQVVVGFPIPRKFISRTPPSPRGIPSAGGCTAYWRATMVPQKVQLLWSAAAGEWSVRWTFFCHLGQVVQPSPVRRLGARDEFCALNTSYEIHIHQKWCAQSLGPEAQNEALHPARRHKTPNCLELGLRSALHVCLSVCLSAFHPLRGCTSAEAALWPLILRIGGATQTSCSRSWRLAVATSWTRLSTTRSTCLRRRTAFLSTCCRRCMVSSAMWCRWRPGTQYLSGRRKLQSCGMRASILH